ncbi:hypothetical protein CDAR_565801 [Caerostris darwini]|uniref:Uncharacterized protein n=1 Tax=Caerostris darwini TaxID=1538125 RepID=A0AAV4UYF3_9ARAC|nr:hypothetical protein CDAR_565801 [Caerostris darwini]
MQIIGAVVKFAPPPRLPSQRMVALHRLLMIHSFDPALNSASRQLHVTWKGGLHGNQGARGRNVVANVTAAGEGPTSVDLL